MFDCAKYELLCAKQGKSPSTFPVECGASKSTSSYTSWRSGTQPKNKTVKVLADALGVDVTELNDELKTHVTEVVETDEEEQYQPGHQAKEKKPTTVSSDGLSDFDKMLLNETEDFSDEEKKMVNDYVLFVRSLRKP